MSPGRHLLLVATAALWLSQSFAMNVHPNIFIPSSNATCLSDYAWMNNAEGSNPCLMVAYVIAACVGDTWVQPALPPNSHYDAPSGSTATPCYCSWSCYNLMMGCTLCQNQSYTNDMMTWAAFSQNCPSDYSDDIFPQNYVIANNMSIPYWATTNSSTWPNGLFDISEAQTLANEGHPDYYPSGSSPGSSGSSGTHTNVGAIVGGTVGGAAALLILAIGGFCLYKRRKYRRIPSPGPAQAFNAFDNTHARRPSDPSTVFSAALSSSPPPMSYTTTQPYGSGMSMTSPMGYSSFQAMSPPPTDSASLFTTGNTAQPRNPAIPIV